MRQRVERPAAVFFVEEFVLKLFSNGEKYDKIEELKPTSERSLYIWQLISREKLFW